MTARTSEPPEPGSGVFVLGVWAALTIVALVFVLSFGAPFPRWDDFAFLPFLTGSQHITLDWLWSQHNEHRIPWAKLVSVGLLRASGSDFRVMLVAIVAVLSAGSLAALLVACRRRGAWRATDAVLPLTLLHLGHASNLLWSFQFCFAASAVLTVALLLIIVSRPGWPDVGSSAGAVVLLALLATSGACGIAPVPAFALWFAVGGAAMLRAGDRRAGLAACIAALIAVALVVGYFHGFVRPGHTASRPGPVETLSAALQFLSLSLGPTAATLWPYSGILIGTLLIATVGLLARVVVLRPDERPRAVGMLAFLGGVGSLALGMGFGRAGASALGAMEPRYVVLAAPLMYGLYFAWDLYGPTPALRRLVPLGLLATSLVLLWPNTEAGLIDGRRVADGTNRLERAIKMGLPTYLVIKEATPFLHPSHDALARLLPEMRAARLGIFRLLKPNPPFRAVDVPLEPIETRMVEWKSGTARVTGVDPQLTFALPEPRFVAGVHLRYSHENSSHLPARFKLAWRRPGQPDFPENQTYPIWNLPSGKDLETTIWVGEALHEIRIQPDNQPCEFRIEALQVLVPEG